jgi:hypothetical protein
MKNKKEIQGLKKAVSVLKAEIQWCKDNPNMLTPEQHEWFVAGIKQSIYLIEKMITITVEDEFTFERSPLTDAIETANVNYVQLLQKEFFDGYSDTVIRRKNENQ